MIYDSSGNDVEKKNYEKNELSNFTQKQFKKKSVCLSVLHLTVILWSDAD
jgi:hypothetical protein